MRESKSLIKQKEPTAKELMNLLPKESRKKVLKLVEESYEEVCICNGAICEIDWQYKTIIKEIKETMEE